MIINGLKPYQAVEVGDKYLVALHSYANYEVGGETIVGHQVMVSDIKSVVHVKKTPPKVEYFTDLEGNRFEPSEVYKYLHGEIDDYDSPEEQIEFLRKQSWAYKLEEHKSEEKVERVPVEFEVVGSLEDTGSSFIETALSYGSINFSRTGGLYKVHRGRVAKDELLRLADKYSSATLDIPSHGHLEFAKVSGSYVFTSTKNACIKNSDACVVTDRLADAKAIEEETRQMIRKIALPFFNPKKVSDIDTKEVIAELKSLQKMLGGLKLKVSSSTSTGALSRKVEKIENMLLEAKEVE